MKAAQIK